LPRGTRRRALLIAIAAHALFLLLLRHAMREPAPPTDRNLLYVDIADLPMPEPALPVPPEKPLSQVSRLTTEPWRTPQEMSRRVRRPADQDRPSATVPPELFDASGIAIIPDEAKGALPKKADRGFEQPIKPSPFLEAKRPLKVRPNHFAGAWAGDDGQALPQRLYRHLVYERGFTAPWGGRYRCSWIALAITSGGIGPAMGCVDLPEPAWTASRRWKPATEIDAR
jgi:hypothetical protein